MYQQNVLIGYVSYLQIGKEYYVTFCKNKQIKIKEICSVWCNCVTTRVVCIHNYYYNIQGLCTHVHVAILACTKQKHPRHAQKHTFTYSKKVHVNLHLFKPGYIQPQKLYLVLT